MGLTYVWFDILIIKQIFIFLILNLKHVIIVFNEISLHIN
jgi:hypothetical protein